MINCPQCDRLYEDGMRFCLDDGSPLAVSAFGASTAEYRGAVTQDDRETETVIGRHVPVGSSSIVPVLVVLAVVIGGIILLAAAGVAGIWYYAATGSASMSKGEPPTEVKMSPTPLDTLGDADPVTQDGGAFPDNKVTNDPRTVDIRTEGTGINANTPNPPPMTLPEGRNNPANGKPVSKQISGGVLNGKAVSLPKPPYPPAARAVRASGAVMVRVLVDESGNVVSAHAVSGHPLLRAAALSAARRAKFAPTKLSGEPVRVSGVISYNFVAL